ncbi:MAG: cysteine desulfurase [Candidatus Micrarchaeota archaeon]|nr:cysteine desulfurase [Candidatus Micrarchaeota archaeon]
MAESIKYSKNEFKVENIRADFPNLKVEMNGKPLVYLDSAATSQRPRQVLEAMDGYYKTYNANIHRGIYRIAEKATEEYIDSKNKVAKFINGSSIEEIVYVRNATEAINLVALSWGNMNIEKEDHILISEMEHHSNMVPWMLLAKRKGASLDYIPLDRTNSKLDMAGFNKMLDKNPKIVAVTHASNVLGTVNDVKEITKKAHKKGAKVLIDGAQSVPHMKVDVREIDSDFFAFSAHKMLGPTGLGVLHAKAEILNGMDPVIGGGDMIKSVKYDSCSWNDLPWKFEAGTPNIAGAIGLGAAIDYLEYFGMDSIREHEKELTAYALEKLTKVKNVTIYGPGIKDLDARLGVIAFSIDKVHPHDVAQVLDAEGVAIRAGHHCAMPLVTQKLGVPALSRMSFYIYNKESEIDAAVEALEKVKKVFKVV